MADCRSRWSSFRSVLHRRLALLVLHRTLLLNCVLLSATSMAAKPPNIIIVVIDDLGWDDTSLHGSPQIPTPNIDQLAKEGVVLNKYYTQPICTPSRAALMTGMYPTNLGLQHDVISGAEPWGLPAEFKILPQYLQEAGYESHIVGKWHLGHSRSEFLPTQRGFKSHFGFRLGHSNYYSHWGAESSATPNVSTFYEGLDLWSNQLPDKRFHGTYGNDLFTQRAIRVLQTHNTSVPLFLYLPHQAVHVATHEAPLQAPREFVEKFNGKIQDEKRKHYAAMVSALDSSIGTFMKAVKDNHFDRNTIIFFTNDNGGPTNGMAGSGSSNHPLRGCKYTLWEGGVRGTGIIWAPGLLKNGQSYDYLAHITDIVPTMLRAANLPIPTGLDGLSLWDHIRERKGDHRTEMLHNIDPRWATFAYRLGDFKLISGEFYNGRFDSWYPTVEATQYRRSVQCGTNGTFCSGKERPCLFNITHDPCEQNDLFDQYPDIVRIIGQRLKYFRAAMRPLENKPPTPLANPALYDYVWLPWEDFQLLPEGRRPRNDNPVYDVSSYS